MTYKNFGFNPPTITGTHYVEGDGRLLGASVLNPSGDWEKSLPVYEPQAENFETFGCTVWGLQNQVETLHKYLYGIEPNYDEGFNFNLAKIEPPGTDPQISYETGRRSGFIQGFLPMTETLEEFKKPRPMIEPYLNEGKKWLQTYFFDHDWVLTGTPNPEKLRTNLTRCPLGVSVTAWIKDYNGDYIDKDLPNSHWCILYKMDNDFYYVFDSYDHSKKSLPIKGHKICYAKRIVLYKRDPKEILKTYSVLLQKTVELLKLFINYVSSTKKTLGTLVEDLFSKKID